MAYQSLETKIGMILIKNAGLTPADLDDVLRVQRESSKKIGEILIEKNLLRPEDISKALALQLGLPYVEDLKPSEIDAKLVSTLNIQYCRENRLLPIYQDDQVLRIAVIVNLLS